MQDSPAGWSTSMSSPSTSSPLALKVLRICADNLEEFVAAVLLAIIGISMAVQVLLRTLFDAPLGWPEELSQFLFVWASTLGAIGAIKRRGLIRLEFFVDLMPRPLQRLVGWIVLAGTIAVLALLFWYGWSLAERTSFTATALPITWAWAYAAAPAFTALAILRLVQLNILGYRFSFVEEAIAARRRAAANEEDVS